LLHRILRGRIGFALGIHFSESEVEFPRHYRFQQIALASTLGCALHSKYRAAINFDFHKNFIKAL
jgi:hypothetical protein